jgi:hypothetical protein
MHGRYFHDQESRGARPMPFFILNKRPQRYRKPLHRKYSLVDVKKQIIGVYWFHIDFFKLGN